MANIKRNKGFSSTKCLRGDTNHSSLKQSLTHLKTSVTSITIKASV